MIDNRKFRRLAPTMIGDLMREFGLADWRAAAIVGNAGHESGGFTMMQERQPTVQGSRGGFGWFQWTGPRRRAFEAWCVAKQLAPSSYEANVGFLIHELRGEEKAALAALRKAKTFEAAVIAFERAYERAGKKHDASRLAWARIALAEFRAKGANAKPLETSRTAGGAIVAGGGGAAIAVEGLREVQKTLGEADAAWSAGGVFGVVIGVLILAGAAVALYARWDDAGRPWPPWRRGKVST